MEEPMKSLLTFLGTGEYRSLTYTLSEDSAQRSFKTDLFPEAAYRLFQPDRVLVCVTEKVEQHRNFAELKRRINENVLLPIGIPEGRSEAELWEIFEKICGKFEQGESLILDITHAFRSLPVLVFAVALYLRQTKGVKIDRIIYGAFEARDEKDVAPIFDLTLLLELVDWLSSAGFLLKRGDGTLLGDLLKEIHEALWKNRPSSGEVPKNLKNLGERLHLFSKAIHFSRPRDVMVHARELVKVLDSAYNEVHRWAKPFALILAHLREVVALFSREDPDLLDREHLNNQLSLVSYFVEKGLLMQAITLAREWLVNWVLTKRGQGDWLKKEIREEAESIINEAARRLRESKKGDGAENLPDWWESLGKAGEKAARLWNSLSDLRNDIAHCGMRTNAAPVRSIEESIMRIPDLLRNLAEEVPDLRLYGGRVEINIKEIYGGVARLDELPFYIERAKKMSYEGADVVLTGQGPIWLYLAIAHALHGVARRLLFSSPTTGEIVIFDHTAK
jgi:CRISPR-associated DxTHG motif protein